MPNNLIPSIEKRVGALHDILKSQRGDASSEAPTGPRYTITISREFGCEGYPLAEDLKYLLEDRTGRPWMIYDKSLIDKVLKDNEISPYLLKNYSEINRIMDSLLAMISKNWKSTEEAYRLIMQAMLNVAQQGDAILVGRGAAFVTGELSNCFHFRLVAPLAYKVMSYSERLGVSKDDALKVISENAEKRDAFHLDFLNHKMDPSDFHMTLNNAVMTVSEMSLIIGDFLQQQVAKEDVQASISS